MAKGKSSSSGPAKNHGPKRKMFKEFKPMIRVFAQAGLLNKYHNYESWILSCNALGKRNSTREEFQSFLKMSRADQDAFFDNLRNKGKKGAPTNEGK